MDALHEARDASGGERFDRGDYPGFSDAEMERRRSCLAAQMERDGVDHLVLYGAEKVGSAVGWLTGWPVTREAAVVFTPGLPDLVVVQFYNHVANARQMARAAEVRWGGASSIAVAAQELRRRRARRHRVGVVGPLPARLAGELTAAVGDVGFFDKSYEQVRMRKSPEEIDWVTRGASLTDRAVGALVAEATPGHTEADLCAIIEGAYLGAGGTNHIHYLGVTPMRHPETSVPAQWPRTRELRAGDALTCEVSASFWGYPGQLLRTFSVADEASPLFREMHDVAEAARSAMTECLRPGATAAELYRAAGVIYEAGYSTCDDLVHGFVGGYLPPVIAGPRRFPSGSGVATAVVPDFVFEPGMTVVVQPNVTTSDGSAGVQTGELVLVTESGCASFHSFARGIGRLG